MENPLAVANFFISKGLGDGQPPDPMKVQKLVYFGHGWHLAFYKNPLIDEFIEAWPYGPVVPTIYHEFKKYGPNPITNLACDLVGDQLVPYKVTSPQVIPLLDRVWQVYKPLSALALSELTHRAGSPWHTTWEQFGKLGIRGANIGNDLIKAHFDAQLRKNLESAKKTA